MTSAQREYEIRRLTGEIVGLLTDGVPEPEVDKPTLAAATTLKSITDTLQRQGKSAGLDSDLTRMIDSRQYMRRGRPHNPVPHGTCHLCGQRTDDCDCQGIEEIAFS